MTLRHSSDVVEVIQGVEPSLWTLPTLDLFAIDDRNPQGDHPEDDKNDKDGSDDNSRIHDAILSGRGKTSFE